MAMTETAPCRARPSDALERFRQWVAFLCAMFEDPDPLAAAACRPSFKTYVPNYYRHWFGADIEPLTARHLQWFRRLRPVLALPAGSRLLDFGGGFGMDSIFLASLGYRVTFYEVSTHHIAIAKFIAQKYAAQAGPLDIQFVCVRKDPPPTGFDAVLLDEVAHHIEPVTDAFDTAARMLKPGGSLFLLEPNFLSLPVQLYFFRVRGFKVVGLQWDIETGEVRPLGREHIRLASDWAAQAGKFGFRLTESSYIVPWLMRSAEPSWLRRVAEQMPVVRAITATHLTMHFVRP